MAQANSQEGPSADCNQAHVYIQVFGILWWTFEFVRIR